SHPVRHSVQPYFADWKGDFSHWLEWFQTVDRNGDFAPALFVDGSCQIMHKRLPSTTERRFWEMLMNMTMRLTGALGLAAIMAASSVPALAQSSEVNVYSYREPGLIQPLLDKFTEATGVKANVLFAGDGLLERVAAEGELSPADV